MEDVKKRIEFNSPVIQLQAVGRIYAELKKKTSAANPLEKRTPQVAELESLLECCSCEQPRVSMAAVQALVELVLESRLHFTLALHSLLNLVPSARCVGALLTGVGRLLTSQALALTDQSDVFLCPYTTRSPPHPFILALSSRPACWPQLLQQASTILQHPNPKVRCVAVELLRPFLQFVLLSPAWRDFWLLRPALASCLASALAPDSPQPLRLAVLRLAASLAPALQVAKEEDLCQWLDWLSSLLNTATLPSPPVTSDPKSPKSDDPVTLPTSDLQPLVTLAVTSLLAGVRQNLSIRGLVCALRGLDVELLGRPEHLAVLAQALSAGSTEDWPHLLSLGLKIVRETRPGLLTPVARAFLLAPLLVIVGNPETLAPGGAASLEALGVSLLEALVPPPPSPAPPDPHPAPELGSSPPDPKVVGCCSLTEEGHLATLMSSLGGRLSACPALALPWLTHVRGWLPGHVRGVSPLTPLVSALVAAAPSPPVRAQACLLLSDVARLDPAQGASLLPLLLLLLAAEDDPHLRLLVLEAIPASASHKFCVPAVLRSILVWASHPSLRAEGLRVMTRLWEQQDRTFPHLLRLLKEWEAAASSPSPSQPVPPLEVQLAAAAAIQSVCKHRPVQHGAEVLGALSTVIHSSDAPQSTPALLLALQALSHLCRAEVTDIRSTWDVLKAKLIADTRPAVTSQMCDLLSLVPVLAVPGDEYEAFQGGIQSLLWGYCGSPHPRVQSAAFQALAAFPIQGTLISYLPTEVTVDLRAQYAELVAQQPDTEVTLDSMLPAVPGVCFTRILSNLDSAVLPAYSAFLSGHMREEVRELPRGIYHTALRRRPGVEASQEKAIGAIPDFLLSQFERTRQPGLRPALAVGLLFCYDPPLTVGRDGRPRKHYVVTQSKNYQQMLNTLLHEVPVQPSEWHRSLVLPQAWSCFMERLFPAVLEGRKAELQLQVRHGHLDAEEAAFRQDKAWLWVRDSLVNTIKSASRGGPSVQGNSVLALAGLVIAASRHAASLESMEQQQQQQQQQTGAGAGAAAEGLSEHASQGHWQALALDTLLALLDPALIPRAAPTLGLGQQYGPDARPPAPMLARCCAAMATAVVTPVLVTSDRLGPLLSRLSQGLPRGAREGKGGQGEGGSGGALVFHQSLALGMLLGRLFQEKYSEVGGSQGTLSVWKSLDALEEACLDHSRENRSGGLLGLGLALGGLCEEGRTDSRVHLAATLDKLLALWKRTDPASPSFPALALCLALTAGAAYGANVLLEEASGIVDLLHKANTQHPQVPGLALALGTLAHCMAQLGHGVCLPLQRELATAWTKTFMAQDETPLSKFTALNGLLALVGAEKTLITMPSRGVPHVVGGASVGEAVELAVSVVKSHPDLGLQSSAAWLLGHLHLAWTGSSQARSSVPQNYAYLPESSLLRAVVDFLIEASKLGPEGMAGEQVEVALASLTSNFKRPLPPVNWAGMLSPLLRMDYSGRVKALCLKLAVAQSCHGLTAALFLSNWLTAPLFPSLPVECWERLYASMPVLVKSSPVASLAAFLETSCLLPFDPAHRGSPELCQSVLAGLALCLQVKDPPEGATELLYSAVQRLYVALSTCTEFAVLRAMGDCLSNVPDELLDTAIAADLASDLPADLLRGTFIRCYLVANGYQPLALLNGCIDCLLHNDFCDRGAVLSLLCHCFSRSGQVARQGREAAKQGGEGTKQGGEGTKQGGEGTKQGGEGAKQGGGDAARQVMEMLGPLARTNWLLELLGYTHTAALGVVHGNSGSPPSPQTLELAVTVAMTALCLWACPSASILLGLNPRLLDPHASLTEDKAQEPGRPEGREGKSEGGEGGGTSLLMGVELSLLWQLFPACLAQLASPPWDALLNRVVGWMLDMLPRLENCSPALRQSLLASLLMLRHTDEFRRPSTWSAAWDLLPRDLLLA